MLLAALSLTACSSSKANDTPPVATPSFAASRTRVPLGSPIETTYKFVVSQDLPAIPKDYRVLVHFLDADDELMWTDDHDPPVPTDQWKRGQTIEYTRTLFIPIYPWLGEASVLVGLYSSKDGTRLPLVGADNGQRAYRVAKLQLQPQSENIFLIYKDGWHRAEVAQDNPAIEWQWTKKLATLSFRNPRKDCLVYLQLDGQPSAFPQPQQVKIRVGEEVLETFAIDKKDMYLRKIQVKAASLGAGDMVDLAIEVDKTFIPGQLPGGSADPRELGVRVFHAFVQPQS